jgi:hypothetical protein
MSALTTTIDNVLKNHYIPPVVEQLNNENELLSRIESFDSKLLVGSKIVLPLHSGRSAGIGSRAEAAALPTAGYQKYNKAEYTLTHHYGRIKVSGVSMAVSKSNLGAFLEVLKGEMEGIKNDLGKDIARQVWGPSDGNSGGNGRIVQCGTTTASNVIVLGSAEPLRKGHLYVGMKVDIGTSASPTSLINGEAITAINVSTPSITVTTAVTTSSSHYVCRAGNAGNELTSLQDIVSTAANTVGGINASTEAWWDNQRSNLAGSLTLDSMQQLWNTLRLQREGTPDLLLTTPGLQRIYFNLLQSQVRYLEPMRIKGGYEKEYLAFNNKPLVDDVDAKFGRIYFLNTKSMKKLVNEDWHWLDEDGTVLKWVTDYDSWEAAMVCRFNLGAQSRNNNGVLYNITNDTTGV